MKNIFLIICTIMLAHPAMAESLSGLLIERGTRKPLADVNIFFLPQKLKATTLSDGSFSVDGLEAGNIEVIVNQSGYQRLVNVIPIPYSGKLNLYLEKESYRTFESVVTTDRTKRDENTKRLKSKDFLQSAGSGGDPIKAVQNLSGVNRASMGTANVIIQGAEPEDTGYFIDGQSVPLIFHFGGLSSIVIPEAVDSVDFYSAGYGPEFGRFNGGLVGLTTRDPKTDRRHGYFFADFINTGGLIEGPIDEKSSYLVGGRYSYISLILGEVFKDNESASLTIAPAFQDFTTIYKRNLESGANLKLTFVQSDDVSKFLLKKSPSSDPFVRGTFYNRTQFWRLIPQWNKKLDETTEVNLSAGVGNNSFRVDIDDNYLDIRSLNLSTRGEVIKTYSPTYKTFLGFDNIYNYYDVATRIPNFVQKGGIANPIDQNSVKIVDAEGKFSQIGIYSRNELKSDETSPITYLPSIRFDRIAVINENLLQPRFALKYQASESLKYFAATGLYFQPPAPQQTDSSYGNPEIKSQEARHLSAGFEKDFREGSNIGSLVGSSLFYKQLDNLIISSSDLTTRNGKITFENFNNDGTGYVRGAEFNYKYFADNWAVALAYTYTYSRRQNPGEAELPSEYDQTNSLSVTASHERGKWSYSSRFRYVSGNPYTPIVGSSFDSDNDVYFPVRGEIFSERKKPFMQLDLRADYKIIFDESVWGYYFDIQNALNTKNEEAFVYSYDFKEKQAITGLPLIPSFGIKGEF